MIKVFTRDQGPRVQEPGLYLLFQEKGEKSCRGMWCLRKLGSAGSHQERKSGMTYKTMEKTRKRGEAFKPEVSNWLPSEAKQWEGLWEERWQPGVVVMWTKLHPPVSNATSVVNNWKNQNKIYTWSNNGFHTIQPATGISEVSQWTPNQLRTKSRTGAEPWHSHVWLLTGVLSQPDSTETFLCVDTVSCSWWL